MSSGLSVMQISKLMGDCDDAVIFNGLVKTNSIVNDDRYKNIMCSISGGSDSDIMLDICQKVDVDKKIKYVWFDTGIEWQATKDHLAAKLLANIFRHIRFAALRHQYQRRRRNDRIYRGL